MPQALEVARQGPRAVVAGVRCELLHFVRERYLDDQHLQVVAGIQHRPQGFVRLGVAAHREYAAGILHRVAQGRHAVQDVDGVEVAMADGDRVPGAANLVTQHRLFRCRQAREIGPDDIVEQVILDCTQGFVASIHGDGCVELFVEDAVHEERQACNVVEVRVRYEDVSYRLQFGKRKVADTGADVDQDVVVHEHRRGPCPRADTAAATKYSNTHNVEGSIARHHVG